MNQSQPPQPLSEEAKQLATGYVLGDLTEEEATRLETLLAENPALVEEIHALETSYTLLPQALEVVEAPASLREKVLTPAPIAAIPSVRRVWQTRFKWLAGLAAIATLLLLGDNLRLRNQLRLVQDVDPDRVATILRQPNSRLIALTGNNSEAAGTLLFTPGRWQEVIVSFGNLPPLPPDQIYHMWLALENGEVIYCGEFNTGAEGSVFIRLTPPQNPPEGVKATELYVTTAARQSAPNPSGERIMEGTI